MADPSDSPHRSLYKQVGSPPWKEAFRQGCLERMRNSRDRLLNRYRQTGNDMPGRMQGTLLVQEVMEEEWNAMQSVESCSEALVQLEEPMDLAVLEEIQQELIDQEQSIISEYEKSLQFDEKCVSIILAEWEANPLICPVCTKYNLRIASGVVMCQCGLHIPSHSPELTEQKLRACLEDNVNEHSARCPHTPAFSLTKGTEKTSLLMSCLDLMDSEDCCPWFQRQRCGCRMASKAQEQRQSYLTQLSYPKIEAELLGVSPACDTWALIL